MPQRSRRIAILSHCHLNVNTKVHGLAHYRGARTDVVSPLIEAGIGIVQLPCPEATYLGMRRWGMTREQYDVAAYRRHCRQVLAPTIDTLVALADDGCVFEGVFGVNGSPSCGVSRTCVGYEGGEIEALFESGESPRATHAPARGVFMEVLQELCADAGIDLEFRGVDESAEGA